VSRESPHVPPRRGASGQVAYLTTVYPSPSHSFIRREILGLEAIGWRVHRFAHRHNSVAPVDPADKAELRLTCVLLDLTPATFALAALTWLVKRPIHTTKTFLFAMRLAWRGDRRFLAHAAYFAMACTLSKRLLDLGCSHLHAHFGTNPAEVACLAQRLSGMTYSVTFHGPHEFDPDLRLNLPDKIAKASFVATVSKAGLRRMLDQFPEFAAKFRWVPCGLDAAWFDVPPSDAQHSHDLICVARLDPQKDPLLLLAAARALVDRGVDFHLKIAGDGMLRGDVETQITASGLASHVTLLGWQSQQKIIALLRAARALVLSSHDEGLPVAIMEAFALGVPAIAPDVGGVRELVESGASGWLVPRGDVSALADAMQACLRTEPVELRRLGGEARRRVRLHDVRTSVGVLAGEFGLQMLPMETADGRFGK
jgi:glycosyltransferase involved in cell wall biosynthesis